MCRGEWYFKCGQSHVFRLVLSGRQTYFKNSEHFRITAFCKSWNIVMPKRQWQIRGRLRAPKCQLFIRSNIDKILYIVFIINGSNNSFFFLLFVWVSPNKSLDPHKFGGRYAFKICPGQFLVLDLCLPSHWCKIIWKKEVPQW